MNKEVDTESLTKFVLKIKNDVEEIYNKKLEYIDPILDYDINQAIDKKEKLELFRNLGRLYLHL